MNLTSSYSFTDIQNPSLLFIENTIISCFEDFKKSQTLYDFEYYKRELEVTNLQYIFNKYPVAEGLLKGNEQKTTNLLSFIPQQLSQDTSISPKKMIDGYASKIKDIEKGFNK